MDASCDSRFRRADRGMSSSTSLAILLAVTVLLALSVALFMFVGP